MKKITMLSAAAAVGVLSLGTSANAEITLPNDKWQVVEIGTMDDSRVEGLQYVRQNANWCKVWHAEEVTPGAIIYGAQNPGGNIVDGKGTEIGEPGETRIELGSSAASGNVACPAGIGSTSGATLFVVPAP